MKSRLVRAAAGFMGGLAPHVQVLAARERSPHVPRRKTVSSLNEANKRGCWKRASIPFRQKFPNSSQYCFVAFSALRVLSDSRSFMRALCNCDLLLPMEHPTMVAISLCSYPSTSCSTKILRYPGGSASTARCSRSRSMDPDKTGSCAPSSFLGVSSSFPACRPAGLRGGSSCATASGQRLPSSGAAR